MVYVIVVIYQFVVKTRRITHVHVKAQQFQLQVRRNNLNNLRRRLASSWAKSQNVRIHGVRIEKSLVSEIFGVGFSAMLMQVMTLVQQTVLYNVASHHGGESWQIILGAALSTQSFGLPHPEGIHTAHHPG